MRVERKLVALPKWRNPGNNRKYIFYIYLKKKNSDRILRILAKTVSS